MGKLFHARWPFQPADDEIILRMVGEGKSYIEIGRALRRNHRSVGNYARRKLGVPPRVRFTDKEGKLIRCQLAEGRSYGDIAKMLGNRNERSISFYANKYLNLSLAARPWDDGEIDDLSSMVEAGYSYPQIAGRLGRTLSAVRHMGQRLGASVRRRTG
jgi:hypothetical protein